MASVDWYDAGLAVGCDLADSGGTAANVDVSCMDFASAKSWLDGVLDGLREKGFDAKTIAASSGVIESLRDTAGWQEDETYRGISILLDDQAGSQNVIMLQGMQEVPREFFVEPRFEEFAYEDSPLPIKESQTISRPYIVALVIEQAAIRSGDPVLEVGTDSGYAAAVANVRTATALSAGTRPDLRAPPSSPQRERTFQSR